MNRYRGVDARALGHLLNSDTPINCLSENANECSCGSYNRTNNLKGLRNSQGEGCIQTHDAHLASSCAGDPSLAMVYSPYQHFHMLYSTTEALCRGTLFMELDKPWKVGGTR